ncbi:MarR family winged helix-turn-helix transcriptional regulator [Iningainema tapete]|uniref:MarR family transcriptional regulator n=1 Tax=Iningainema tapete BLCC-T55 TaxID=2748662 RepID=A0A8J6XPJ1_9CYAN|nr:MarR family transcriptional regulator [Iningainema tapete]MBD2775765.1 MarR family transcriptional regulator [Iningainema tapete BLCC-T55]
MSNSSTHQEFLKKWRRVLAPYDMGYRFKLVSQLMYRDFLGRLEPFGLTPFHWLVLCCLWEEDGLPTSVIAEKLGQLGATLTGVVDRMEERHLVRRERDASDRRIVRIWLTPEGENLKEVLPPLGQEVIEKALAGISDSEREYMEKILDRIVLNFS